jgi:hypothetical protein
MGNTGVLRKAVLRMGDLVARTAGRTFVSPDDPHATLDAASSGDLRLVRICPARVVAWWEHSGALGPLLMRSHEGGDDPAGARDEQNRQHVGKEDLAHFARVSRS